MAAVVVSAAAVEAYTLTWLYPLLRVAGFVMTAPVMGTRTVPARARLVLILVLTALIVPLLRAPAAPPDPLTPVGLLTVFQQLVIGIAIGLVLRMAFLVFEFAGQVVAQQMGLGFAAMVDPTSGAQVPVLAHLYLILASLIFFASDAHLALLRLLFDSFTLLPIGERGFNAAGAEIIVDWSASLIGAALVLALPIVIALLAINLAFGVMARAAPQLNLLAVGFPVMMLAGVVFASLSLDGFIAQATRVFEGGWQAVRAALEAAP